MSDEPLVTDSSSASQVRKARSRAGLRDRQRRDRWQAILESPQGKACLWEILEWCGAFTQESNVDVMSRVVFREGKRNIGLRIINAIESVQPGAFARLIQQHHEEKKRAP